MKKFFSLAIIAFVTFFSFEACSNKNAAEIGAPTELKTHMDSVAYIIGSSMGKNFQRDSLDINLKAYNYGMKMAMDGDSLLLNEEQMRAVMTAFQETLRAKQEIIRQREQEEAVQKAEEAKKEEDAFFAENKKKPGVKTIDGIYQYEVLKSGTGASPNASDKVRVHYHGTLLDGTVFDSSVERGEPAEFPLNSVIPGWTETIPHMKVGDKWRIYIPSAKGYGSRPNGKIPANSTLIFEVELLDIVTPVFKGK